MSITDKQGNETEDHKAWRLRRAFWTFMDLPDLIEFALKDINEINKARFVEIINKWLLHEQYPDLPSS